MSRSHSFSVDVANAYGVNVALMLNHFSFWYLKNKSDGVNFIENDFWIRMKIDTMREYYPYFSKRQLRHLIDKMIDLGLLNQDEFNDKKNDRTRWYSLTKTAKQLLNIWSDKNVSPSDKNVSPSDKNVSSIEGDTKYRYILLLEGKIKENLELLEIIAMQNKLKITTVENAIKMFVKHSVGIGEKYNSDRELFRHFQNWVRVQKLNDQDVEKEVEWFINKFNKISGQNFKITENLTSLFVKQLSVGFTGKEMVKAIQNLYSSSVKNVFHIKHSYKFATPEYLLKDDNLNKYLNFKV